jgi:hypothetical protein
VLPLVRADARERDITAATIRGACRYLAAVRVIPSSIGARVAIEGAIAGPIYWSRKTGQDFGVRVALKNRRPAAVSGSLMASSVVGFHHVEILVKS